MAKSADDFISSYNKLIFLTGDYPYNYKGNSDLLENRGLLEKEYQKRIKAIREVGFPELVTKKILSYYQFEFMEYTVFGNNVVYSIDIELVITQVQDISFKTALDHLIMAKGDIVDCIMDILFYDATPTNIVFRDNIAYDL